MRYSSVVMFCWIRWNLFPFKMAFNLGNRKKSQGTISSEYGGRRPPECFYWPKSRRQALTHDIERYRDADATVQRPAFSFVFYEQHFVGTVGYQSTIWSNRSIGFSNCFPNHGWAASHDHPEMFDLLWSATNVVVRLISSTLNGVFKNSYLLA